jgi:hypothetical protein
MNHNTINKLALLIMLFATTACYKKLEDFELGNARWNPELALPLVNSSFTMEDFLESLDPDNLVSEENGAMLITYTEDSIMSTPATSFFNVGDKSFPKVPLVLTAEEINTFNTSGTVTVTREIPASLINEQKGFDSIWVETGAINFNITENFPANGSLEITLPSIANRSTNEIITENYSWTYDGINTITNQTTSQGIANHFINFNGAGDDNEIFIAFELTLNQVNNTPIVFDNTVNLQLSLENIAFDALFGNLGSESIDTDVNQIPIDFFEDLETVNFSLEDPRMRLFFTNGLGLPVRFDISETYAVKGENRIKLDIADPIINLEGPTDINAGPTENTIVLNDAFRELINQAPDAMEFQIGGTLNPNSVGPNFVTKDSKIQVGGEIQIPLYGSASGLSFTERFDLDGADIDGTDRALFRINTVNGLPLDAQLQAYLLNANGERIQTLVGEGSYFLTAAQVNSSGDVTESSPNSLEILLEDEQLSALAETTQVEILIELSTLNAESNQPVKVSSLAAIDISMGAQINFEIDL